MKNASFLINKVDYFDELTIDEIEIYHSFSHAKEIVEITENECLDAYKELQNLILLQTCSILERFGFGAGDFEIQITMPCSTGFSFEIETMRKEKLNPILN